MASASLHLYTLGQTGATGVQVYPDVPVSGTFSTSSITAPWQQPSWNTAPPVVTGSVGITESGGGGYWHNWDVTNQVRQWVQNSSTGGSFTLTGPSGTPVAGTYRGLAQTGSGTLVRFSSPLDASSLVSGSTPLMSTAVATATMPAPVSTTATVTLTTAPVSATATITLATATAAASQITVSPTVTAAPVSLTATLTPTRVAATALATPFSSTVTGTPMTHTTAAYTGLGAHAGVIERQGGLTRAVVPQPAHMRQVTGAARRGLLAAYNRLPLTFQRNDGQSAAAVQYLARGAGYDLFLSGADAMLAVSQPAATEPVSATDDLLGPAGRHPSPRSAEGKRLLAHRHRHTRGIRQTLVQLHLVGANPHPQADGLDRLHGTTSYLLGRDQRRWRTGIPLYARVAYRDVYRGIDLAYYGTQGRLEFDWTLKPGAGADVRAIRLAVRGSTRPRLDRQGDLVLESGGVMLRQSRPVAYQDVNGSRRPVSARYVLLGARQVGGAVGRYDPRRPLVIDPTLTYGSYLGGDGGGTNGFGDQAYGIAQDSQGDVYVTGATASANFPISDTLQGTYNGNPSDAFVAEFNTTASGAGSLVYSTYLGGGDEDYGAGIAVDLAGNAYVTGYTYSTDFPTTANAFRRTHSGNDASCGLSPCADAFITEINTALTGTSALVYSSYLGGGADYGGAIAVDGTDRVYVTGSTTSGNFPTTANALQRVPGSQNCGAPPCNRAFVAAFDTSMTGTASLVYNTYLGGSGNDDGYGVGVDSAGDAYVVGYTTSTDFPVTWHAPDTGPLQGSNHGGADAFVAELSPDGSSLVYSTYLGGSGDDYAEGIAVDSSGAMYVAGDTYSANFPTVGAFQATNRGTAASHDNGFVAAITDAYTPTIDTPTPTTAAGATATPAPPTSTPIPVPSPPAALATPAPPAAPYLEIVYAGRSHSYSDGAKSVYGVSGTFASICAKQNICFDSNHTNGGLTVDALAGGAIPTTLSPDLRGSYLRMEVDMKCDSPKPGLQWWNSSPQAPVKEYYPNTYTTVLNNADNNNYGSVYDILAIAYSEQQHIGRPLIPIIVFGQNGGNCPTGNNAKFWNTSVRNFIDSMGAYNRFGGPCTKGKCKGQPQGGPANPALPNPLPMTYFEIGNEPDNGANGFYRTPHQYSDFTWYQNDFAQAVDGIMSHAQPNRDRSTVRLGPNFRILTAGMKDPTASLKQPVCNDRFGNKPLDPSAKGLAPNFLEARAAIQSTLNLLKQKKAPRYLQGLAQHLGAAVHPYSYSTDEYDYANGRGYWRNYYTQYGYGSFVNKKGYNHYLGPCFDLGTTIELWKNPGNYSPDLAKQVGVVPVIITEDNYDLTDASTFNLAINRPKERETGATCTDSRGCQQMYLVDLFTWLANKGFADPASSPVRLAWFKGTNVAVSNPPLPLGLYMSDGGQKDPMNVYYCPNVTIPGSSTNPIQGASSIDVDYFYLNDPNAKCYDAYSFS